MILSKDSRVGYSATTLPGEEGYRDGPFKGKPCWVFGNYPPKFDISAEFFRHFLTANANVDLEGFA